MTKERLDKILVQRGLVSSRERARAMILAGQVIVDDHRIDKVGMQISTAAEIRLKGDDIPYVSRGGVKLDKALIEFAVVVAGRIALDVGASTGGFTDCLLQHGVKKVYAVDVGYGQLAWKLREDPRVVNLERHNIRHIDSALLAETPDLAVIDASFISLSKILSPTLDLLSAGGEILALIKPQFEVGKKQVGKGGIVKDRGLQEAVVQAVCDSAVQLNCQVLGVVESPILGQKGNREFLIYLKKSSI